MAGRPTQQNRVVAGASVHAQVTFDEVQSAAVDRHLTILGGFHPEPEDNAPAGCGTLLLLGPNEPAFWPAFSKSSEARDGNSNPMDRWSTRVIGSWADDMGAKALFPFGGAPFLPFFSWATRTGRIHPSPIMLLVHDTAGLFVSFRGALAFDAHIDLPLAPPSPCLTCADQPCRTACPVAAFDGQNYDVAACKSFLSSSAGHDCMSQGCKARRMCPISQRHPRITAQSAYHMNQFKG